MKLRPCDTFRLQYNRRFLAVTENVGKPRVRIGRFPKQQEYMPDTLNAFSMKVSADNRDQIFFGTSIGRD